MPKRNIVEIDENKCNGCGLCVSACAEGAIQIIDGKARLVSDVYCDGLGACLGHCPQDAIRIVQREAAPFDQQAVEHHLAAMRMCEAVAGKQAMRAAARSTSGAHPPANTPPPSAGSPLNIRAHSGCPGLAVMDLARPSAVVDGGGDSQAGALGQPSALRNWPVQLKLVPPHAPYLAGADLLLAADCVPFALADFHRRFLEGRVLLVGCPKLDDAQFYVEKLAAIVQTARPRSLTVIHMEVPCCTGLVRIAQAALQPAGSDLPVQKVTISVRGEVLGHSAIYSPIR